MGQLRFRWSRRVVSLLVFGLIVLVLVGAPRLANSQMPSGVNCSSAPDTVVRITAAQTAAAYRAASTMGIPPRDADGSSQPIIEVRADSFGLPLAVDETARQYINPSVLMHQGDSAAFDVAVPVAGDYILRVDVAVPPDAGSAEGQLRVNGNFPVPALQRFTFPAFYRNSTDTFPRDRYGNEALIRQERDVVWANNALRDADFSQPYPIQVSLPAGDHRFEFTLTDGSLHLGSVYVSEFTPYPDYAQYQAAHTAPESSGFSLALEAELPSLKNDTALRPVSSRNLTVTPYDTYCLMLNTLGGESWIKSGSTAFYEFTVPEDGMYAITLRALQDTRSNFTVFRRFSINGEVPFAELNAVPFPYSADWQDVTLGGVTPTLTHLREGVNVLGIEATNAPYLPAIETIQQALIDINALALEINRLTGNQRDPFK